MRKYLPRRHYYEADRALMWNRWQEGESLHTIGCLFERVEIPGLYVPARHRKLLRNARLLR